MTLAQPFPTERDGERATLNPRARVSWFSASGYRGLSQSGWLIETGRSRRTYIDAEGRRLVMKHWTFRRIEGVGS